MSPVQNRLSGVHLSLVTGTDDVLSDICDTSDYVARLSKPTWMVGAGSVAGYAESRKPFTSDIYAELAEHAYSRRDWCSIQADWVVELTHAQPLGEGFVHTQLISEQIRTIARPDADLVSSDQRRLAHDTLRRTSNGVLIAVVATQFVGLVADTRIVHPVLAVILVVTSAFFLAMSRSMRRQMKEVVRAHSDEWPTSIRVRKVSA